MPSAKKSKSLSHQVCGVLALEVDKILQATPPILRNGDVAIIIHVHSLYIYTYSSLEPLAPSAPYLVPGTVHASAQYTTESEVRGSVSRGKTSCEQGLPHYTYYKQSNAFLMRRRTRRSAVSPWNVDPLRSTTLHGIHSARILAVAAVAQMDRDESCLARCGTR